MPRFITLTDHEDHKQGASPLIIDADRVVALAEFERHQVYAGRETASGVGTKIVVSIGNATTTFYVQETIYIVAGRVAGDD